MNPIRIGMGYDVHRLVPERDLILGGVKIPHTLGPLGHSDADVLVHAIMDAILGALGLGDIGKHFPDTDEQYGGISSMTLLDQVAQRMDEQGYSVGNIDGVIIAQKPKCAPYIPEMVEKIARSLKTDLSNINIKATTEERLGFTGREEGIAAEAVALLVAKQSVKL